MSQIEIPEKASCEDEGESRLEFPPYLLGVVVAVLAGFCEDGRTPLVKVSGSATGASEARTTVPLNTEDVGRQVVVVFEHEKAKPIVIGCLREAATPLPRSCTVEVDADGNKLIVSAREQIVLRCGEASITLTKAGKVLISGAYVSSRSSGVNRVQGGSVELN